MTREPSIHITRTDLERLLKRFIKVDVNDKEIDFLMKEARNRSITSRSVIINAKKDIKKVTQRLKGGIVDANLLAQIICSVRVKMKHINVKKITQADPQWGAVKELVDVVNQFCSVYELEQREGYIKFITLGLKLMSSRRRVNYQYAPSWLNQHSDWIVSTYESESTLNNDDNPQGTEEVREAYCSEILYRTGIHEKYDEPELKVHFHDARKMADELGMDYYDYIKAQFDKLSFCNGIPKIENLYSDKAKRAAIDYMSKHRIKKNHKPLKIESDVWEELKA